MRKEVPGDVAPLLRRVSDRVGSEADPIPHLLIGLVCFVAAFFLLRKAVQEATQ